MATNDRPVVISPTLVIGLGGTGALAAQYAKALLQQRLGHDGTQEGSTPPFFSFLVLDTTPADSSKTALDGDEFLNIGHQNVSRVVGSRGRHPALSWFPRELDPGQIDSGARGVRQIGRLCFFLAKPKIERLLREKIRRITNYEATLAWLRRNGALGTRFHLEPGAPLDVHIVSSLCGGTGSACVLDMAYLAKQIVSETTQLGLNPTAHLVTPEPFESESIGRAGREYIHYNFFLSLAEIEHFVADGKWYVPYLDGSVVRTEQPEKPFRFIFLIGNKVGASMERKEVARTIGHAIVFGSVTPGRTRLKELLENVTSHVLNGQDDAGRLNAYSSYGLVRLSLGLNEGMKRRIEGAAAAAIVDSLTAPRQRKDGDLQVVQSELVSDAFNVRTLDGGWLQSQLRGDFWIDEEQLVDAEGRLQRKDRRGAGQVYKDVRDHFHRVRGLQEARLRDAGRRYVQRLSDRARELVEDGYTLSDVTALLERAIQSTKDVIAAVGAERDSVRSHADVVGQQSALESCDGAAYRRLGTANLRQDVYGAFFDAIDGIMTSISTNLRRRSESAARARGCLEAAQARIDEWEGADSALERSVADDHDVSVQVQEQKRALLREFLRTLATKAAEAARADDGGEAMDFFLDYLNCDASRDRSADVTNLLRQAAGRIDQEVARAFNLNPETLRERVSAAKPLWQIEDAGTDVEEVSVACGPENDSAAVALRSLGAPIEFVPGDKDLLDLCVVRSEHGVSITRLLALRSSVGAVARRLAREGKSSIAELCLDPSWGVFPPIAVEELLRWFALGCFFGVTRPDGQGWVAMGRGGLRVELSAGSAQERRPLRLEAWRRFAALSALSEKAYEAITHEISERRRKEQEDRRSYAATLKGYVEITLPGFLERSPLEGDAHQIRNEMGALTREIEDLQRAIADEDLLADVRRRQHPGGRP